MSDVVFWVVFVVVMIPFSVWYAWKMCRFLGFWEDVRSHDKP